jgi:hypothetical protein
VERPCWCDPSVAVWNCGCRYTLKRSSTRWLSIGCREPAAGSDLWAKEDVMKFILLMNATRGTGD